MFTSDDLKRLAAVCGPCLTIFEPIIDDFSKVTKPAARLAGAAKRAGRLLEEKGFSDAERAEMVSPILKFAANTDWKGRSGSIALFRSPGFTMAKFWPEPLPSRIHFGQEFLVLPLLPGILSNREFWLLALSINAVRLYRGSRTGLEEAALPKGVPVSLAEAGGFDWPDHNLTARSNAGRSLGNMKTVQFGTGSANEIQPDHLHDFFAMIDRGIHPILMADRQPLILAGVTRELAIYRRLTSYSPLLAGAVHGSPEALGPVVLFERARQLISAHSELIRDVTLREMDEAAGRNLIENDPAAVIEAAKGGQVDELVVAPEAPGFGGREEEINWTALAVIRGGGRIRLLSGPEPVSGISAVLRYRATAGSEGARQAEYAIGTA